MNLFILRHASAGIRRTNSLLDLKRPLDKDGKRPCLPLAHVLNALKIQFDLIVSSPLKRSLQTASLVGTETGYEAQILLSNALAPEATLSDFQKLLHQCRNHENLLVVGHNPNITSFLGALLAPPSTPATAQIRLPNGPLSRLSLIPAPATLHCLLDPPTVRALYAPPPNTSPRK